MGTQPPLHRSLDDPCLVDGELQLFALADEHRLRDVTEAFATLLGYSVAELGGRPLLELVHPADREAVQARLDDRAATVATALDDIDCRFAQAEGSSVYLQWALRPRPDGLWWACATDVPELRKLLGERRELHTRLELAIGQPTAAMWNLDVSTGHLTWEPQAAEILGVAHDELPVDAVALAGHVATEDAPLVTHAFATMLREGSTEVGLRLGYGPVAARHLALRGRIVAHDEAGRPTRAAGLLLDISTEQAMAEQLLRLSVNDSLTGTPNRRAFEQALHGEWRRAGRARQAISILRVDIDRFTIFNDTFGHLAGDQALVAIAQALRGAIGREGDVVARYGGEEFAVILPGVDVAGARVVADRMMEAVRAIELRHAPDWRLSVSVGCATWNPEEEAISAGALLSRADEAQYAAKQSGKDRVVAYEESLAAAASLRAAIARGLREEEFELHYQPIVSLDDEEPIKFEALIRWRREGELVSPAVFIPAAEATNLICDIGRWALAEASEQLRRWLELELDGVHPVRVAVNLAARHAGAPGIREDVEAAVQQAGIPPDRLELELTETGVRHDHTGGAYLRDTRALGVSIAIDDFGTGFTSIGELANLHADVLKIDRMFVASEDPRQQSLVGLMVEAAHTFGMTVVAEGIEEPETVEILRRLGCDSAQGFLFARPMPAEQATEWLAARVGAGRAA